MYMNFGPVGHNGGGRRLNVAITRAKCNIKLVGSILPSDIDINRAKSEGARMLRSYIEYARKGASALRSVEKAEAFFHIDNLYDIEHVSIVHRINNALKAVYIFENGKE